METGAIMDGAVLKPVRFEEFLKNKKFQNFLRLRHFNFHRDVNGRLIVHTARWIYYFVISVHMSFFCLNSFDIARSLFLRVPCSQNLPVLTIATFFSIRGLMLVFKRTDIMDFLLALDEEFPSSQEAQSLWQVRQALERHLERNRYSDAILIGVILGYCCTPFVVYLVTYEGSDAFITENQQLLGGYLPYGVRQKHWAYPLVYTFDMLCVLSGSALYASVDTLYFSMQGQLIMHLNYLNRQICATDMRDDATDEGQLNAHLCQLIRRQQKLSTMFDQFNDIFKLMLMVTDLIAATTICFHLYLFSETEDIFLRVKCVLPSGLLVLYTFETCLRGTHVAEAVSGDTPI